MAGQKISALTAVTTPLYTDVLPDVQSANVNVSTSKISLLQTTQLINATELSITASTVLPSPCPTIININFTTPGQTITLPPATGANGHPAGKPIWFKVASTNSQNFSILTNDGLTTFLTATGTLGDYNDYIITYSQNSTQNGTPIRLFVIPNFASLGTAAYQNVAAFLASTGGTLTGNLIIDGAAAGGFYGLDVNKNANASAQINIYNSNVGSSAAAQFSALTEGADATYSAGINAGNLLTWGIDASDGGAYVICTTNALGSGNIFRISQAGVPSFPAAPLPVGSGGTNATTAATARTSLGAAASGANTDITSVLLNNSGLAVKGVSGASGLVITPGSTLTTNRILTLTTGDAARTLDISAANVTISTLGALIAALTTLTQNGVIYGNGSSAPAATTAGTTGQLLIGATGSAPAFGNSVSADTTFTTATSGATRTLLTQSTSNTASAGAIVEAQVAGGTAADAVFKSTIVGGQTWTLGGDNSDSDAFALSANASLGTTNVIRISPTGEVNFPLLPFAMAKITASQANITGDNTTYNITGAIFTELFDQANNFSNGTFTAPRTGIYRCNLNIVLENVGAAHVFLEVDLVTTGGTYVLCQCNPAAIRTNPGTVNTVSVPVSIVVPMTATDTAYFNIVINGSTKTVGLAGGALYSTMSFKLDA